MCPEEAGYGDYVVMKIGADGTIANWKCNEDLLGEFTNQEH